METINQEILEAEKELQQAIREGHSPSWIAGCANILRTLQEERECLENGEFYNPWNSRCEEEE